MLCQHHLTDCAFCLNKVITSNICLIFLWIDWQTSYNLAWMHIKLCATRKGLDVEIRLVLFKLRWERDICDIAKRKWVLNRVIETYCYHVDNFEACIEANPKTMHKNYIFQVKYIKPKAQINYKVLIYRIVSWDFLIVRHFYDNYYPRWWLSEGEKNMIKGYSKQKDWIGTFFFLDWTMNTELGIIKCIQIYQQYSGFTDIAN